MSLYHPSQKSEAKPHSRKSTIAGLITAGSILVVAALVFLFRQQLIDYVTVQRFQPSSELQNVLSRTHLSEKGKYYVYASQAQIVDRTVFNEACGTLQNEKTVVLGCYTTDNKRLYVYNVTDARLAGVREATTAHEMLHAVYDRLEGAERARVDVMVSEQAKHVTDRRLLELITFYEQSEPGAMASELHSILGTEVRSLNPELEAYYAQYFSDRAALVAEKERYETVFSDVRTKQQILVGEMSTLASEVERRTAAYQAVTATLNADIATFNTWAKSNGATRDRFVERKAVLEGRIASAESERDAINQLVTAYNAKRDELIQVNLLAEDLTHSLESNFNQLPSAPSI